MLAAVALGLLGCLGGETAVGPLPAGGTNVLFVGNSLTYVNDLPSTLSEMALSTGDTIYVGEVALPDYALIDHLREGSAMKAIKAEKWHYVVLQQGPSSVQVNRDSLVMMTRVFDAEIRKIGAKTALYSVWPQMVNYSTFDRAIESYRLAATAVNGVYLPVGLAWKTALSSDSSIPLYMNDGLHPSELGTWLAALVMYEKITGKDARALPAKVVVAGRTITGVPPATITLLQKMAHDANVASSQ